MKRSLRICAWLLSGCIFLSSFVISNLIIIAANEPYEQNIETWDGGIDTSWYDSEEQELYVYSANEFAGLASLVNAGKSFEGQTVYLESDIDLSGAQWTPIGLEKNRAFSGILDGKGHTINNLICTSQKEYYGLFGFLSGTVRYLSLNNCKCSVAGGQSRSYASCGGGIAAVLNSAKIEKCSVSGNIIASIYATAVDMVVGGVAGKVIGNCEITNCHMEGNVSLGSSGGYVPNRNSYAGGICGLQSGEKTIIDSCSALATVFSHTGSYEDMAYAGGVCGAALGSLLITNSYNCGNIEADSKRKSNSGIISDTMRSCSGGIIGYISSQSKIENVYNIGISTAFNSGGVIGEKSEGCTVNNTYYMTASANSGVAKGDDTTIAKSTANMKKEEFAKSLGDVFVYVEGSYPKLAWEMDRPPANTDPKIVEIQVKVGESTQMAVTNYTGSVTWVSQNPEIATINSDGVVTGLKPGKASLFAILDSGKALSGTIQVTEDDSITTIPTTTTLPTTTSTITTTTTPFTITATTEQTTTVTTEPPVSDIMLGDVNGDKEISVEDAQLTLNAYVKIMTGKDNNLTEQQVKAADVNADGIVSVDDAQSILNYYVKNVLSGSAITWDELLGRNKQTQPRPALLKLLKRLQNQ